MSTENETTIEVNFIVTFGKDGNADIRLKDPDTGCPIAPKPICFPTDSIQFIAYTASRYSWVCHQNDSKYHLYKEVDGSWVDLGHVGNYGC